MTQYNLRPNESIVLKSEKVSNGGMLSSYSDELLLTNQDIIYVSKGIFGNVKNMVRYPINQIKTYEGEPQVSVGKHSSGNSQLEIFFTNSQQRFVFQSFGKREAKKWVDEICKLVTGHSSKRKTLNATSGFFGTDLIGDSVKGTVSSVTSAIGISLGDSGSTKTQTKKCKSCGAPIVGSKGQTVRCQYCDTEQKM